MKRAQDARRFDYTTRRKQAALQKTEPGIMFCFSFFLSLFLSRHRVLCVSPAVFVVSSLFDPRIRRVRFLRGALAYTMRVIAASACSDEQRPAARRWRQRRSTSSYRGCLNPFAVSRDRTTTSPAPIWSHAPFASSSC